MGKYKVTAAIPIFITVEVEVEDKDGAIDAAYPFFSLTGYVGNGGYDKLIGTREPNVSLDVGCDVEPLEKDGFSIDVEEF